MWLLDLSLRLKRTDQDIAGIPLPTPHTQTHTHFSMKSKVCYDSDEERKPNAPTRNLQKHISLCRTMWHVILTLFIFIFSNQMLQLFFSLFLHFFLHVLNVILRRSKRSASDQLNLLACKCCTQLLHYWTQQMCLNVEQWNIAALCAAVTVQGRRVTHVWQRFGCLCE